MVRETTRQTLHRVWPAKFIGRSSVAQRGQLLDAAHAYDCLGEIMSFENDAYGLVNAYLSELNLAERAGSSAELARAYASAAMLTGFVPLPRIAQMYRSLAKKTAENVDDPSSLAWVYLALGCYETGIGEWEQAGSDLTKSIEHSHHAGDWNRWEESSSCLADLFYFRGRFSMMADRVSEVEASARRRGNDSHIGWALEGEAHSALRQGKTERALDLLEEALKLLVKKSDRAFLIDAHGLMAISRVRLGDFKRAELEANAAMNLIGNSRPTHLAELEDYAGTAETYLSLWQSRAGGRSPIQKEWASEAHKACTALLGFSRIFPVGGPRAWLCKGWALHLENRLHGSRRALEKGLSSAKRLAMPCEEARLHYEISRCLKIRKPESDVHLARACELFTMMEATHDLALATN